ncbi:MAG: ACT domain-containing protein [Nitrososphaerota archaeon]|nr:ACT domain-containing protein [Nitrososphaerota archaeon]
MIKMTKNDQSINKLVGEVVSSDDAIEASIIGGYANLSGVARLIRERLSGTRPEASVEAIVSALKRYKIRASAEREPVYQVLSKSSVMLRTSVAKVVLGKGVEDMGSLLESLKRYDEDLVILSKTLNNTTIIFDVSIYERIKAALRTANIVDKKGELTAITVHSPAAIIRTPGCLESIYSSVSNAKINVEDTTSCYTDTVLIVKDEDAGRAFDAITRLINASKRLASS